MLRSTLLFLLFWSSTAVFAEETLPICHGYSCVAQVDIRYSRGQLGDVRRQLFSAVDAADERKMLAEVIGQLYRWAGQQSDVRNDRGGNYADGHAPGKMDCIDHSTSTTRLLGLLEKRGYLRWHRVLAPEPRYLLGLVASHWSAVIEEITENNDAGDMARFVVDSWFVDNGEPAVILPLADWKKGAGPDV
ncbi:hypothetical protein [Azonexus sp.]|uniref:hypothetical protein n=1 Tax=Azonexus sp. TaxID=1872668 RepID=UPI0027B93CA9|nr:hypothetical protein [Azonexus sp.]